MTMAKVKKEYIWLVLSFLLPKVCFSELPLQEVTIHTKTGPVKVIAEIADEPKELSYGLMNRKQLSEEKGMLFVYDHESSHSFWMKNTIISLDMIFISADKKIVSIVKKTKPLSTDSIQPNVVSQYILEVNGGFSDRHGVKIGDELVIR